MLSAPARALLLLGFVLVAGCKPDPFRPDAGPPLPDAPPPDGPPPWWQPVPGEAADWDIQLAASPFDVSTPRAMYTIDLWDAVPSVQTLDYGDGTPVTVPAGANAGVIAQLQGQTPPAIVVCHVGTGAIRLDDPDAVKFRGYTATPPDRPDPLATGSVIGWSTPDGGPNERFIDIHETSRDAVVPLIAKRIELARAIGCDAIAAMHNDLHVYQNPGDAGHGFAEVMREEYMSWSRELATRAHAVELSIGPRTKSEIGIDELSMTYDWMMTDRCAEYENCTKVQEFINKQKAVFAIEYKLDEDGNPNTTTILCSKLGTIRDAIFKTAALDSTAPERCP